MSAVTNTLTTQPSLQLIVGIGASAGGLEALEQLFDGFGDEADIAFVVVTHLSPDYRSLLDELLARRTPMPVTVVEDGVVMRGGAVYVLPPKKDMIVSGMRLFLRDRDVAQSPPAPIDTFFHSLAREWGARAVGVILSGTGRDGSRGLVEIKRAGGRAVVQSPNAAQAAGMPEAAIKAAQVDRVVDARDIGAAIAELRQSRNSDAVALETDDDEALAIERIVRAVLGVSEIDFSCYKTTTFKRRVDRRIAATHCNTVTDYARLIEEDPTEARRLSDDLLIGVTEFFRDRDAFEQLSSKALEELFTKKASEGAPLRVWCAGCATGQEAYSIAIAIKEIARRRGQSAVAQIFATDIRESYLEIAGRGVYSAAEVSSLEPSLLARYFTEVSGSYQVKKSIRQGIVFAQHDLLKTPPFTKVDLIVCRNVVIYVGAEAQQRIFALFHFALNPQGFLFMGPSESLGTLEREFNSVDARWRIYQKSHDRPLHVGPTASVLAGRPYGARGDAVAHRALARRKENALTPAYGAILEQFAPPSALISSDRELLHLFGDARRFFRPAVGVVSLDVAGMVDSGLKTPLVTGIERCLREKQEVVFPGLPLRDEAGAPAVKLRIVPLLESGDAKPAFLLVIFTAREQAEVVDDATVIDLASEDISRRRADDLEQELERTRETLQATIEEVETSNEELQSSNEELMAANEELQSTNEELNSVNEELLSVNAEYQRQNDELSALNSDMESLLKATDICVIFVDSEMMIRRVTSSLDRLFNIISGDVGRRLADLTHNLIGFEPVAFIEGAITRGEAQEIEVLSVGGEWWMLRCIPHEYSVTHKRGAVLTAINIDRLKKAERIASVGEQRYRRIADLARVQFFALSDIGELVERQEDWEGFTGQAFADYLGMGWIAAIHSADRAAFAQDWAEARESKSEIDRMVRLWRASEGDYAHVRLSMAPTLDESGQVLSWSGTFIDIETAVQAENVARRSEQLLEGVLASTASHVAFVEEGGVIGYANPGFEALCTPGEAGVQGRRLSDALPGDVFAAIQSALAPAHEGARSERLAPWVDPAGAERLYLVELAPYGAAREEAMLGRPIVITLRDVTEAREKDADRGRMRALLTSVIDDFGNEAILFDAETLEIRHASRRALRQLGYGLEELTSMQITALTPTIRAERWRDMLARVAGDERPVKVEAMLMMRSGALYDCDIQCEIVGDGHRRYGVAVAIDITDRLEVAQSLRERTAELAASNRDLEQFASAASHDLRAPLNQVSNFIGIVLEEHGDELSEPARTNLDIAARRAERLQLLVSSLLEYSRLYSLAAPSQDVDLKALLSELSQQNSAEITRIGGKITIGPAPVVRGDPILLERLFQNLITNSMKYRGSEPLEISINLARSGGEEVIEVVDNGVGVQPKFAERIFAMFAQLRPSEQLDGVGLGLPLCRRVMELHRGKIWLDPEHEGGARFLIAFPSDPS